MSGDPVDVPIDAVGAQGDGLATTADGRRLYVPYGAPGDFLRVALGASRGDGVEARVLDRLQDGPRQAPICDHFGTCGGCSTQHLPDATYRAWKGELLVQALVRRGLAPGVEDLVRVPPASRRRATFAAVKTARGVAVGFLARRDRRVIDIAACPLLVADLNRLLDPLKSLLDDLLPTGGRARVAVAALPGGVDVILEWGGEVDLAVRERLAAFADAEDLARLSLSDGDGPLEPIAARRPVTPDFGRAVIALPAGGFLQPSQAGEAVLRHAILARLGDARRIVELFAGAGTFTLALADRAPVLAIDDDAAMIAALATGAGRTGLGGRVTTAVRDLAARPLLASELNAFDTAVLDPPRAGALAQVREIAAASTVRRVVMVSCNPATFARDARVLVDGGFKQAPVQPIDQFPFSHHLECVGAFHRDGG